MKLHIKIICTALLFCINTAFAQNCDCDHIISGLSNTAVNQIYAQNYNYEPGDTFCVLADTVAGLRFIGFEGTADSALTIINCGGEVVIKENMYSGIDTHESRFVVLSGSGDPNIEYGFHVIETGTGGVGVALSKFSSDIEVHHIEIENTGFAGLMAKTDPNCTDSMTWRINGYVFENLHVHHNYIHDTEGEGMYIGYTGGYKVVSNKICNGEYVFGHWFDGVDIHDNILENTGWDGIQVTLARTGAEIHHNTITNWGVANATWQNFMMSIGGGIYDVYNNFGVNEDGNEGNGIQLISGQSGTKFYNNVIINPFEHGIFMHARHEFDDTTNGYYFLNNTIISPEKSGVFYNPRIMYSEDSSLLYVDQDNVPLICRNNLIAYPGSDYASGPNWRGEAECYFDFNAINTRDAQVANIHHNVKTRDLDTVGILDSLNNDYSPSGVTSYLYNTGYDVSVYNVTIDYNDIPRPQHALFDIGAYEYNDLHIGPLEHLKQFLVYPNPFDDCITLKHTEANSISLFDLSGKCVYKNDGDKSLKHCLAHLDSGLYFISVNGAGLNHSQKIVKR
jgi:hypothetical protein